MIQYRPQAEVVDLQELHRQLAHDLASAATDTETNGAKPILDLSRQLIAITAEIFPPGPLEISLEFEPDEPDMQYLVFTVEATGDSSALLARRHQWHLAVADVVADDAIKYRLSIYPR
jgi:hypothetical protein